MIRTIDQAIQNLSPRLHKHLLEKGITVSTAESCTGGGVASAIVENAGSSDYFMGGVVAYSNRAKMEVLGVKSETLERVGAVSRETAVEMAEGVRRLMHTDIGVATTGITGPGGGSKEKPVGTIWVCVASDSGIKAIQLGLEDKGRHTNCRTAIHAALTLLAEAAGMD